MKTKNTMKPLKTLDIPVVPAEVTDGKPAGFAYLTVGGTCVYDFCNHAKDEAAAKKDKEKDKELFLEEAVDALYAHNMENPNVPVKTIKVTDAAGGTANVTFKDQYSVVSDQAKLLATLKRLGVTDPNELVSEALVIGFDTTIFYDADGNVLEELYTAFLEAMQKVSEDFLVPCPFSSNKVLRVKPDFHKKRWLLGQTTDDQAELTAVCPNQTTTTPVVK